MKKGKLVFVVLIALFSTKSFAEESTEITLKEEAKETTTVTQNVPQKSEGFFKQKPNTKSIDELYEMNKRRADRYEARLLRDGN